MNKANNSTNILPYGLKKRLNTVFLGIILAFSLLNIFSLLWISIYSKQLAYHLTKQAELQEAISSVRDMGQHLFNYSRRNNSDYLIYYYNELSRFKKDINRLLESEENNLIKYQLNDINKMINTLEHSAQNMFKDIKNNVQPIYVHDTGDYLIRLSGYIITDLQKISEKNIKKLGLFYVEFSNRIKRMSILSILFLLSALIVTILVSQHFLETVTRPIHILADHLVRFGEGNLELRIGNINGPDEIGILCSSFDNMAAQIRNLVNDIKGKAELERKLNEQQIARQEAEKLLKESELSNLQAQINPHFLFNTLNILSSLSLIENAEKTTQTIGYLSELLRYSLNTSNKKVKLKEEISSIRNYMAIQTLRFQDKLEYIEDFDPDLPDIEIPGMILQPLIENAIKHGIEPIEQKGILSLRIKTAGPREVEVIIRDNGAGISENVINMLNSKVLQTRSIGITNVKKRLEYYYGKNVFSIYGLKEGGTECRIFLSDIVSVL